ncbi:MAG: peptidylprolyl isomerase [Rhodothermales bacterium]
MRSRIAALVAYIAIVGLFSACQRDDHVESLAPLEVPFDSSIHDSLIVATVEYHGVVDTFSTGEFNKNMGRLNTLFPEVMQDEARSLPIREEMMRQYVLERLLLREAARRELMPDSSAIEAELDRFKSKFESTDAYRQELEDIHQTESDLREQFRATIAREALVRSIEDSLPAPTASEVESYREALSTRLRVQHILIGVPEDASKESLKASRQQAEELLDSLDAGRSFAMLARRFSDDAGSKVSGGELPWFRRGEMVPEFEKAAFQLKEKGDYTHDPVRTPYGYHLIRLLERQKDDVVTADSARALLLRQRVRAAHEELQRRLVSGAVVRTNPDFIPASASLVSGE